MSNKGFALIEVMVALAFLAITLAAFASLLVGTIRANAQARHMTAGTNLAQDQLEQLRNMLNPVDGVDEVNERGEAGGPYRREWEVEVGTPTATSSTVTVVVRWNAPEERSVQLQTIIQ